jgi:hydroxyacylglutathione hydrolase
MALLIVLACVIGLLIFIGAGYAARVRSEIRRLSPVPTGLIVDGIYAIRDGHVNMYLIHRNGTYVAVDAGRSIDGVEKGLKELNIEKGGVAAVFLTHSDRDHTAALKLFQSAKVCLPKEEEPLAAGKTRRMFIFGNRMDIPYEPVGDGQAVVAGGVSVRCLATPGHTPGSMCYVVDDRYLFTGDTMSLMNGRAGLFSDFFNMDSAAQRESLRRIGALPGITYVFTGHHGITDDYEKAFER